MSIKCGLHTGIALTNGGVVIEWNLPLNKSRTRDYIKLEGIMITQLRSRSLGICLEASWWVALRAAASFRLL